MQSQAVEKSPRDCKPKTWNIRKQRTDVVHELHALRKRATLPVREACHAPYSSSKATFNSPGTIEPESPTIFLQRTENDRCPCVNRQERASSFSPCKKRIESPEFRKGIQDDRWRNVSQVMIEVLGHDIYQLWLSKKDSSRCRDTDDDFLTLH